MPEAQPGHRVLARIRAGGRGWPRMVLVSALGVGLLAGAYGTAWAATSLTAPPKPPVPSQAPAPGRHLVPGWRAGWHLPGMGGMGPGGMGPAAMGRGRGLLTAIGNSTLTMQTPSGQPVTLTTTSSTQYREGGAAIARSSLAVGDPIEAVIVTSSAVTPTATSTATERVVSQVDVLSSRIRGVVLSVSGSSIVLTDFQGFDHVVQTSASTTYTKDGKPASSSAILPGEVVTATGMVTGPDRTTLAASSLQVGVPVLPGSGTRPVPLTPPTPRPRPSSPPQTS